MSWLYDDYDWGQWSEWGPWIPDCLDNFDGRQTIFSDQETYQPKRFRSRNCYKTNSFGTTTADEVALSDSNGKCVFGDKFDVTYGTCPEDEMYCRCPVDDSGGQTFTKVCHIPYVVLAKNEYLKTSVFR